jgi:hypothetical protein
MDAFGLPIALFGAAFAVFFAGIGSAVGLRLFGRIYDVRQAHR